MLKMSKDSKAVLCSSYMEGLKPTDVFFFALFPSVYPGGWNVPVLFVVPDGVKCAKNAFKEESLAEDTQPVQWRLG